MSAVLQPATMQGDPFDLADDVAYRDWRARKLADRPPTADALLVDLRDPSAPTAGEVAALATRCERHNMAVYRSPRRDEDPALPRALGRALGLERLDANWLADADGLSRIEVGGGGDGRADDAPRGDYIPYTDRAIGWHTDGYYHPQARKIQGMILHCVRAAAQGGENALVDHECLYIALRDANPAWVRALMAEDAMTIPERTDEDGVARAAQSGPVFSVRADGLGLHMRYTSRTRSILWKQDAATTEASAFIRECLQGKPSWMFELRLLPGMGIVANNVLHARSRFVDDVQSPRLIYRARYLDHVLAEPAELLQELPA